MNIPVLSTAVAKRLRRTFGTDREVPVRPYRASYFYTGVFHNARETHRAVADAWLPRKVARVGATVQNGGTVRRPQGSFERLRDVGLARLVQER